MGKWIANLAAISAQTFPPVTDKTAKRGVVSVLAVPPQGVTAESAPGACGEVALLDGGSAAAMQAQPIGGRRGLVQGDDAGSDAAQADDAARARFQAFLGIFKRYGIPTQEAEAAAERLQRRDGDEDDRRMCVECSSLKGRRCQAAARGELPGADRRMEPILTILQRCERFQSKGSL